jgi:PAS domain S-box-containing protein
LNGGTSWFKQARAEMNMKDQNIRVLLVENDDNHHSLIQDMLLTIRGLRFDLDWASTYTEALKEAKRKQHDVYLVDYRIGNEPEGLKLFKELRLNGYRAPIILLTDPDRHEAEIRAMRKGVSDFLDKTRIMPHVLERSIRYAVERAKISEALRESEARFKGVFHGTAIGIALIGTKCRVLESNAAIRRMFGYGKKELHRLNFQKLLHPDDEKENKRLYQELIAGKREHYQVVNRYLQKNGQWMWANLTVSLPLKRKEESQFAIFMIEDITERMYAKEALRESEKKLRILSTKLLEAQEKERKLVAQELHDSIGASLAAIKYALENKLDKMGGAPEPEGISLEQLISMVKETIDECRRISTDLRPSMLDDLGLLATIRWICRKFEKVYSGIRIESRFNIKEKDVPESLKVIIYRVLQEALNNVAKHSAADYVCLSLSKKNGIIELSVEDNGRGFDMNEIILHKDYAGGMGLAGMKERTELFDGQFKLYSDKNAGTRIKATWPDRWTATTGTSAAGSRRERRANLSTA